MYSTKNIISSKRCNLFQLQWEGCKSYMHSFTTEFEITRTTALTSIYMNRNLKQPMKKLFSYCSRVSNIDYGNLKADRNSHKTLVNVIQNPLVEICNVAVNSCRILSTTCFGTPAYYTHKVFYPFWLTDHDWSTRISNAAIFPYDIE